MNNQEAIRLLNYMVTSYIPKDQYGDYDDPEPYEQAIDMAIEALQDDWIPVSERLPEKNGNYIVSLEDAVDTSASFFNGKWFMQAFDSISREYGKHEVLAWQPLPDPYKDGE